jgi:TRAP-type C4-dicarboxylate transport system substrate-binding protein
MKSFTPTKVSSAIAISFLSLALLGTQATAQEKVTLKAADWMPTIHDTQIQGFNVLMKKATELSNGRIQFQFYPAEQLGKGKDMLTLAQSGVADITNMAPAYISDKFPLSSVAELPSIYEGACRGSYALLRMAQPGQPLYEAEFKPNGIRILFVGALGSYRPMTATKKIDKLSEYAGLKMRTAGGPMDLTAQAMGATSIRMPGPDVLASLSRGTLDGLFWPLQSVKPWGLINNLKYWTPNVGVGSFTVYYGMSDKAFNKLPKDLQKVMIEAGEYATKHHCEFTDNNEEKTIGDLKAAGITPVPASPEDVKALEAKFAGVYQSWAESLDKRNKPGTKILESFQAEIKK